MSGSLNEIMNGTGEWNNGLKSTLSDGLTVISEDASITFLPYLRIVMPYDAFPFWVRADLVASNAAIQNVWHGNGTPPTEPMVEKGSLHVRTTAEQSEPSSLDHSIVVFTCRDEVRAFHDAGFDFMWIGDFQGIRFAFTERSSFYKQAGLFHYVGENIFPTMMSQIVDDLSSFDLTTRIISNSLPIWLEGFRADLPWLPGLRPTCPVFPSMIVPDNYPPPYVVIHVVEETGTPWQAGRLYDENMSSSQLVREQVRMTTFGLNNLEIENLITHMNEWMLANGSAMGLCNSPIIQDVKEIQPALNALAMRKSIMWDINYHQSAARSMARQYLSSVLPTVIPNKQVVS